MLDGFHDVHLHADGAHQDVDEDRAPSASAGAFKISGLREREQQAHSCGDDHNPKEITGQAKVRRVRCVFRKPGGQRVPGHVRNSHGPKGQAKDLHDFGEGGDAGGSGQEVLHFSLQSLHGAVVCLEPSVYLIAFRRTQKDDGHPHFGDDHIHRNHSRIQRARGFENFKHRRLVGTSSNPGARNR